MAKTRTENLPDLSGLLEPADDFMQDIQRALLRHSARPLPALSLAEQIASRLAALIALDRIQPGQRILEEDVSAVLGVSRAPVREALRILERDRLLVVLPRRGAHVTYPSVNELRDIFEVRASLWATLVEHVLACRPDEVGAVLDEGVRTLQSALDAGSVDGYALGSFKISMGLCDLCDNLLLADMTRSVALQTLRYGRLGFRVPGRLEQSLRDWRVIQRALRAGDAERVVETVRKRIGGSRDAVLAWMSESSAPSAMPSRARGGTTRIKEENDAVIRGVPVRRTRTAARAGKTTRR
ncbi:MAG: GntR family transcriptional regulator [Burkholderiaceae bacterium]